MVNVEEAHLRSSPCTHKQGQHGDLDLNPSNVGRLITKAQSLLDSISCWYRLEKREVLGVIVGQQVLDCQIIDEQKIRFQKSQDM